MLYTTQCLRRIFQIIEDDMERLMLTWTAKIKNDRRNTHLLDLKSPNDGSYSTWHSSYSRILMKEDQTISRSICYKDIQFQSWRERGDIEVDTWAESSYKVSEADCPNAIFVVKISKIEYGHQLLGLKFNTSQLDETYVHTYITYTR